MTTMGLSQETSIHIVGYTLDLPFRLGLKVKGRDGVVYAFVINRPLLSLFGVGTCFVGVCLQRLMEPPGFQRALRKGTVLLTSHSANGLVGLYRAFVLFSH